jgi:hypothetical protein|nr:MAG TPA: Protein of unknown function (DUF1642) [Caudoviricetes sp.]
MMNKEDLIKKYEGLEGVWDANGAEIARQCFLRDLEQLNEIDTKKVTVPQYVADWIEYCKTNGIALGYALYCSGQASDKKVYDWIVESLENQETFARAWIDGYKIEKEKRYEVILCNGQSLKTVYRQGEDRLDFEKVYGDIERFTRKQLEEAGFGWVFDCEGIEIEEVME